MSERGSGGFGAFLFGIALGAIAGFLFAPEGGESTRRRVGKGLRNLKELAEEKVDEVRGLLKEAEEEAEESDDSEESEEEDEEPEVATREQLRRRLEAARRRRNRAARPTPTAPPTPEEEDEPLA
jgi:gas vesicle protein